MEDVTVDGSDFVAGVDDVDEVEVWAEDGAPGGDGSINPRPMVFPSSTAVMEAVQVNQPGGFDRQGV